MEPTTIEIVTYKEQHLAIRKLREKVFQPQQGIVPELQEDRLDFTSMHLLAMSGNQPVGTVRIKDITAQTAQIERLAILPEVTTNNLPYQIIQKAQELIKINHFETVVVLDRADRQSFYQKLGFSQSGNNFQKLGITYIKMVKQLESIEDIA